MSKTPTEIPCISTQFTLWLLGLLACVAACGGSDGMGDLATAAGSGVPAAGASGTPNAAGSSGGSTVPVGSAGRSGVAGSGGAISSGGAGAVSVAGSPATAGASGSAAAGNAAEAGSGGSAGATAGSAAAAGSGGMAGAAGGSAGAAGGGGETVLKPKCKTSPNQVVVVGDSYLNWITHTFPADLTREAGEEWRMYAVGGCSLGSGGLCLIPDQFDQALADDPNIIASVMSGGGNDILIADEVMFPGSSACKDRQDSPTVKVCQDVVATAISAGERLMQKATEAGIRDVIYMFYPRIPGGGFGGMNPNSLLEYALPKARELCEGAPQRTQGKLRCHFIDLVPVFGGRPEWFADDGIHENSLGSTAMAKEVVRVAKEKCVAQPASSGCCEP